MSLVLSGNGDITGLDPALFQSNEMGFLQSGTGAVATTVQSKLRESVSVKDFGADPTGVTDSTAAIQLASNACGVGTLTFPNHSNAIYKINGKVTLPIGQSIDFCGSTIDLSSNTGVAFSYNDSGAAFSFIAPPTIVSNGKINGNASNLSCYPFKFNRVPYVTVIDVKCYTSNVADVYGESILMNFVNVVSYNPIATSFKFSLGTGAFGPNATTFTNCYIEEAINSNVVGIQINSGTVTLIGCYLEALQYHCVVNGGDLFVHSTNFNLRKYTNTAAVVFSSISSSAACFTSDDCVYAFGEGVASLALNAFIFNCSVPVKITDNVFSSFHNAGSSSTVFKLAGTVDGVVSGNRFFCLGISGLQTIFDLTVGGGSAGLAYLNFNGNQIYGAFGSAVNFISNSPVGYAAEISVTGNTFLRATNFINLQSGLISNNNFLTGPTITWTVASKGMLNGNTFGATPTVSNASQVLGNKGYEFGNTQQTRITTGSIGAGALANVTVPWPRSWPGVAYSVSAIVVESTFGNQTLIVDHCCAITATTATFVVKNNSAGALTGTLHATATYDVA